MEKDVDEVLEEELDEEPLDEELDDEEEPELILNEVQEAERWLAEYSLAKMEWERMVNDLFPGVAEDDEDEEN